MSCFFLKPGQTQIFANLNEPKRPDNSDAAVLLCYPFGQEYMRAHRAFRQLANLISRRGMPVMRFDYPGNGDSYGELQAMCFDDYISGARLALDELRTRTQRSTIYIVGLRLGALVAAKLGAELDCVKRIVLWDPFATGEQCISDWHSQLNAESQSAIVSEKNDVWWLHGYPLSVEMREQVAKINLTNTAYDTNKKLIQVISHENEGTIQLSREMKSPAIEQIHVPTLGDWNYVDMDGSILMPTELIKQICNSLVNT